MGLAAGRVMGVVGVIMLPRRVIMVVGILADIAFIMRRRVLMVVVIVGDMVPGSIAGLDRVASSDGVAVPCIPIIAAAGMATCGMMPMAMRTTIRGMWARRL